MRTIKTIGIVLGMYAFSFLIEFMMLMNSPDYQGGIYVIVILGIVGFMSTKVGYRWFDCLFTVIPIYGIVYIFRIANRIAFLPNKDWAVRA